MKLIKNKRGGNILWALLGSIGILSIFFISMLFTQKSGEYNTLESWETGLQDHLASYGRPTKAYDDFAFVAFGDDVGEALANSDDVSDTQKIARQLLAEGMPYDRIIYAMAIERLVNAGAKLVVLDIEFFRESNEDSDQYLTEMIAQYRDKVVLTSLLSNQKESEFVDKTTGSDYVVEMAQIKEPMIDLLGPLNNETAVGYTDFFKEPDNIIRLTQNYTYLDWLLDADAEVAVEEDKEEFKHWSLSAVIARKLGYEVEGHWKRFRVPEQNGSRLSSIYPQSGFSEIFSDEADLNQYKGKVVIIGAANIKSKVVIPEGELYSSQLHLHIAASIIRNDFLESYNSADDTMRYWLWGGLGVLFSCIIALATSSVRYLILSFVSAILLWIAFMAVMQMQSILMPVVPTVIAACAGIGVLIWRAIKLDSEEKKLFQMHLGRSMSPKVAAAIVKAPEGYYDAAAGQSLPVTVFFSDVRDFTSISEKMSATALIQMMNRYFGSMVEVVFAADGTVDKFIGDAIMATWGELGMMEPKKQVNLALGAIVAMEESLERLNKEFKEEGHEPFKIGIGLHHGIVSVGEVGSNHRTDFTVIGDTVNMASRAESLSSKFGVSTVFTSEIVELAEERFDFQFLGMFRVKGKHVAQGLYTLRKEATSHLTADLELALKEGDKAKISNAINAIDYKGCDTLKSFYKDYLENVEAVEWDGVFNMTSK